MKIIAINGSHRKNNNSAKMLQSAVNGAVSAGATIETVNLFDLKFDGCRSCFACKLLGGNSFAKCALKDDLSPVLDKILNADAVIIAMPIYFGDVPGTVRNLFERLWFPGLLYRMDGVVGYTGRVKVGLIYCMNAPTVANYQEIFEQHKMFFEMFLGPTEIICATDTLQFDDYSKYTGDIFDESEKNLLHTTQFPNDCKKAFLMGERITSN